MVKFNLVGFNRYNIDTKNYRVCSIHPYKRLLKHKTDESLLFCPECGSEFPLKIEDTVTEQGIQSKFTPNTQTKIISAHSKKKHYDSFGNLIPVDNDPIIIKDMTEGKRVVYYNEKKVEGDGDVYTAK